MKKQYLLVFLLILLLPSFSEAQRIRARWKAYRFEWSGGIGASNFLGELGGANQVGTNGFKDLEFKATRPAICVGQDLRETARRASCQSPQDLGGNHRRYRYDRAGEHLPLVGDPV